MKATLKDIHGKEVKKIDLPHCFKEKGIREDIIAKVLEAKRTVQSTGASPVGGKQHAASGKIVHRRHVWRSGYGRGMSRIPRKVHSRRGTQFNFVGAEVSSTVGGRRAHPPKSISTNHLKKVNKREIAMAVSSALSSTVLPEYVHKRYASLTKEAIADLPIVVETKITTLKVKDLLESLQKILGKNLFSIAVKKRQTRSGKGKMRGRKYKSSQGLLLVLGNNETLKTKMIETVPVKNLSVTALAKGGLGRLTLYTEEAIKALGEKFK